MRGRSFAIATAAIMASKERAAGFRPDRLRAAATRPKALAEAGQPGPAGAEAEPGRRELEASGAAGKHELRGELRRVAGQLRAQADLGQGGTATSSPRASGSSFQPPSWTSRWWRPQSRTRFQSRV